jgi:hypothetical protein
LLQRTEWTKSMFAIASAAVALTVTALIAREQNLSPGSLVFMVLACGGFSICAVSCIAALRQSAAALESYLKSVSHATDDDEAVDAELRRLASLQRGGFEWGIGSLLVSTVLYLCRV